MSGDADGRLLVWDIETRRRVRRLRGHDGSVLALAVGPGGRYAVSGGKDGAARLWDLETGRECHLDRADWDEAVTAVAYAPDGRSVLAGGSRGRIQLWAVNTGKAARRFDGEGATAAVRYSADGGTVAACARPATFNPLVDTLRAWRWAVDTGKGQPMSRPHGRNKLAPLHATLDLTGGRLVVVGETPDVCRAEEGRQGSGILRDLPRAGLIDEVKTETHGPYGLEVWSLATGNRVAEIGRIPARPIALTVSPENNRILVALNNSTLQTFAIPAH